MQNKSYKKLREDAEKAMRTGNKEKVSLLVQVDIAESLNRIANAFDSQSKTRR